MLGQCGSYTKRALFYLSLVGVLLLGCTSIQGSQVLEPNPQALADSGANLPISTSPISADPEYQLAQRFAPVLKFDEHFVGLPMSAEVYFRNMMNVPGVSPVVQDGGIAWQTERYPLPYALFPDHYAWDSVRYYSTIHTANGDGDGHAELLRSGASGIETDMHTAGGFWQPLSMPSRVLLCGRDGCQFGMTNESMHTLTSGQVPTYYRVIYDEEGRARIAYWWFYGWQAHCNAGLPAFIPYDGPDGAHHGDWEHILVTTTPDRSRAEYVTYFFHGDWYTRQYPDYSTEGEEERPVVYVGRVGHGSYHSQDHGGFGDGGPYYCCEYADHRNPTADTWWYTHQNLISLDANSESWMPADRIGSQYEYGGSSYTIKHWRWGPLHAYCNVTFILCVDWEQETACGNHPTIDPMDWTLSSCKGMGCGTARCEGFIPRKYAYPVYFNQSWPWDAP
jgi:hypothetical protein